MKHSISECIPCWSLLAEKHRRRLQDNAIFRSYKRREHVVFKTVKKDGIVFVLEGGLRVYLASDTGREVTLFHLKKGDAFSIMTVDNALETDVIPCLQSDGETTLAYLQRPDMAVVAHDEWQMALFIYETCAKSAQAILNNISYFVFNDLRHCIARELLEKSRELKTNSVFVTHEEIANSLGTTRVVISRELDKLRDLGIIGTGRGRINILDRAALEKIAGLSRLLMAEPGPGAGSSVRGVPPFRHLVGSLRQPERSLVQQFELRRSPENGHSLLRSIGIRRRRDLSRIPPQSVPGIVGAMLRQIGDLMRLRLLKSQQHRTLTLDHRHDRVPAVSPHVGSVGRIIDPDIE